MAVLKHISVKGSNGGDALDYVMFKHNEMTGEMITDGQGNPVMREEFYLDGINCEPYSFAAECREVNELYGKNQKPEDIKAHHYIVSYDPKDAANHGMTGPKAQQISMEFAEKCFPGFQILVCTHMDGSNETGNIHTHIMMNSVRKYDTDPEAFGEREIDHKAGYKLHLTEDYLRYMKQELMNLCEREGLYQVDLLSPAEKRITDREYRAAQHGQYRLDDLNERMAHDELESPKSMFQTQKQYLRDAVEKVAPKATSFDAFCEIMKKEYNITVKESRGRISYLHPYREKCITGRALGATYEKDSVMKTISQNLKEKNTRETKPNIINHEFLIPEVPKTIEACHNVFVMRTELHLVVQLQNYAKAQKSTVSTNKIMISNVKAMAETILFVQQNHFDSMAEIKEEIEKLDETISSLNRYKYTVREQVKDINEQIHYMGQYLNSKGVYRGFLESKNKKEYMKNNTSGLYAYHEANRYLKEKYVNIKYPTINQLKEQKDTLLDKDLKVQAQIDKATKNKNTISIAYQNIKDMLGDNGNKTRNNECREHLPLVDAHER